MGCVASRIDKVERVQVCKQRKRLVKQLVVFRGDFADAQLAYLKALKNTGVTLRQFTESETLDIEGNADAFTMPASPPQPLPPSPPPPPPLSPDPRRAEESHVRKDGEEEEEEVEQEVSAKDVAQSGTPPPSPPILSSAWESWDPFRPSPSCQWVKDEIEEENWAETKTDFGEEELESEQEEKDSGDVASEPITEKPRADESSSTASWFNKDATHASMVMWRSKKTLEGVAKKLDDYFLKASAGVKEITVLMEFNGSDRFLPQSFRETNGKKGNTAKVFSALSWSRSSKSFQFSKDSDDSGGRPSEPCRPGAHCITLKKLYEEEQKLYKDIKEEETIKIEHERKSLLLRKQEEENLEWTKIEKTRSSVESLEMDLMRLRDSINRTCSSIVGLIDDELYPQIVAITSGLLQMWRKMYESHQAQYHISQLLNHITDDLKIEPSTTFHRHATLQLETEVIHWYSSFCQAVTSQLEYVRTVSRWIKLTNGLKDGDRPSLHSSAVTNLCEKWQSALERLPDKAASEAIKGICTAVHAIVVQQEEEHSLQRKYEKAERRLHKELESLAEMEMKLGDSIISSTGDENSGLGPKHPLALKRAKAEALKKQADIEKSRYLNAVQCMKSMTLNNLRTSLPVAFKALMEFSRGSIEAVEAAFCRVNSEDGLDAQPETV